MAIKTDAEIGKAVRDAVATVALNADIEAINKVTIIINVEAKHKFNNAVYVKGGKGLTIENPNQDTETITVTW